MHAIRKLLSARTWLLALMVVNSLLSAQPGWTAGSALTNLQAGQKAYAAGAYAQAVQYLGRASQQQPRDATIQFQLGLALARTQQFGLAKTAFEQVVQLSPPSDPMARKARNNAALMTRQQITIQSAASPVASRNLALLRKAEVANRQAPAATNYLGHILDNGRVVQWSAAKLPLKVHIAAPPRADLSGMVQQAWQEWAMASGGRLRFVRVNSPDAADIRVRWTGAMSQDRLGVSPFQSVGQTIIQSDVLVALQTPSGQSMTAQQIYPVILHELGHALGLQGHSPYPEDVMFFSVNGDQSFHLTGRDKSTLRLLYAMNPDVTNSQAGGSVAQAREGYTAAERVRDLFNQKRYDESAQLALSALNQSPDHPELLFLAAASFQNLGNASQARQYYQRVLRVDPTHTGTKLNLERLGDS